jgi:hypothetical protein
MLVTADNFLQMFFGWEGVGLASYLLIGFWYKKPAPTPPRSRRSSSTASAISASRSASWPLCSSGVRIDPVLRRRGLSAPRRAWARPHADGDFLGLHSTSALTICSASCCSSARWASRRSFLHTWLPDAMEGPTPVSALIHAATMVTAGVFMVCRCRRSSITWRRSRQPCRHHRRRDDGLLRRHGRPGAERHQARDRLFDLFAARLHVLRGGRRRLWRGDVPPLHARLLQGAAVPGRRLGHPRHAPRAGHALCR